MFKEDEKKEKVSSKKLIAKKPHRIVFGKWDSKKDKMEHDYNVKEGDDVSKLPKNILDILKRENVI